MNGVLYLVYRKLRPALGLPVAFVLMSGALLNIFNSQLILIALGFLFIDLFGNFYNDYWDFEEDIRSGRKDKFTTRGFITPNSALYLSLIFAFVGGLFLIQSTPLLAGVGALYFILLLMYSHNAIHLKGTVAGYGIVAFPYFLIPFAIAHTFELSLVLMLPLGLFFYFQCMYILCQKDSTDSQDKCNLFVNHGWKRSAAITTVFAILSCAFMLYLTIMIRSLFLVLALSIFSKVNNVNGIWREIITRSKRSNFILIEYLSHYVGVAGIYLLTV